MYKLKGWSHFIVATGLLLALAPPVAAVERAPWFDVRAYGDAIVTPDLKATSKVELGENQISRDEWDSAFFGSIAVSSNKFNDRVLRFVGGRISNSN